MAPCPRDRALRPAGFAPRAPCPESAHGLHPQHPGPLAEGSLVTLKLFFITLKLAVPLGLALALIRISHHCRQSGGQWLHLADGGTPLMLQLLFIYFALPFVPW